MSSHYLFFSRLAVLSFSGNFSCGMIAMLQMLPLVACQFWLGTEHLRVKVRPTRLGISTSLLNWRYILEQTLFIGPSEQRVLHLWNETTSRLPDSLLELYSYSDNYIHSPQNWSLDSHSPSQNFSRLIWRNWQANSKCIWKCKRSIVAKWYLKRKTKLEDSSWFQDLL